FDLLDLGYGREILGTTENDAKHRSQECAGPVAPVYIKHQLWPKQEIPEMWLNSRLHRRRIFLAVQREGLPSSIDDVLVFQVGCAASKTEVVAKLKIARVRQLT